MVEGPHSSFSHDIHPTLLMMVEGSHSLLWSQPPVQLCRDLGNIPDDLKRPPLLIRDVSRTTIGSLTARHYGYGFIFKVTSKASSSSASTTQQVPVRSLNSVLTSSSSSGGFNRLLPPPPSSHSPLQPSRDLAKFHILSTMKSFNVGYLSVNVGTEGRQAVEALAEFLHLMDAHFETMAKVRGCADLPDALRDLCWVYLPDDPIHPSWSGLSASEVRSPP